MLPDRRHYERAFEEFLRSRRIPYVSVDEARKALVPEGTAVGRGGPEASGSGSLKSFDFVIYGQGQNLLVDVKGRKVGSRPRAADRGAGRDGTDTWSARPSSRRRPADRRWRLESWVTQEDVDSLGHW
jgi:hypothetical protein